MKLRIEDNTLRLRLSPEEVAHFHQTGRLETVVSLGPSVSDRFTYALQRDETAADSVPSVSYTSGRIVVRLPAPVADTWVTSEEIGIRGTMEVAENQAVHILIEKDLPCKH
jgi:hypothetical protein